MYILQSAVLSSGDIYSFVYSLNKYISCVFFFRYCTKSGYYRTYQKVSTNSMLKSMHSSRRNEA